MLGTLPRRGPLPGRGQGVTRKRSAVRRCLKMAAEEPQQQKQEALGSDSEGTGRGGDVRPGLAGARPGPPVLEAGGRAGGGEPRGRPLPSSPPFPLTMEGAPAATPGAGRAGRGGPSVRGARPARGLRRPRGPGPGPARPEPPAASASSPAELRALQGRGGRLRVCGAAPPCLDPLPARPLCAEKPPPLEQVGSPPSRLRPCSSSEPARDTPSRPPSPAPHPGPGAAKARTPRCDVQGSLN